MITKLLEVRGKKPGKNVQLSEEDIKHLCTKSREIFISQPNLLELEAPIKICGKLIVFSKRLNKNWNLIHMWHICFIRRCSWTVLRSIKNFRVWWLPTRGQLSLPWRLHRSRKAVDRDRLPSTLLQNKVSRELLPAPWKPWMCPNQSYLRLLWWVQTQILD